jgi:hypothetical protein
VDKLIGFQTILSQKRIPHVVSFVRELIPGDEFLGLDVFLELGTAQSMRWKSQNMRRLVGCRSLEILV